MPTRFFETSGRPGWLHDLQLLAESDEKPLILLPEVWAVAPIAALTLLALALLALRVAS